MSKLFEEKAFRNADDFSDEDIMELEQILNCTVNFEEELAENTFFNDVLMGDDTTLFDKIMDEEEVYQFEIDMEKLFRIDIEIEISNLADEMIYLLGN